MHEVEESPVAPAVRILLFVAAALVFLAGVQLFVFPLRTDEYFAWTIASPMTAVFLGAAYWSAVGLEVAAARAEGWAGARIALPTVFVFTALTLVVTLIHLDLFHLGSDFALNTRLVTWFWLAIYGGVPVLMVVAYARQRRVGLATPPPSGLPVVVRVVLVVLAVVLLGFGFSLLVAPSWADGGWPWALTPLTGRAIGAWLIGLGVAAADARALDDAPSLRPLGATGVLFGVLQGVALLRYGDELAWDEAAAYGYVAFLIVLTSVSLWSLLVTGGLWARRPLRRDVRQET
ncbi:MAG: hypothetical protein ABWZ14_09125 [Acidimicrobiales bacterium]